MKTILTLLATLLISACAGIGTGPILEVEQTGTLAEADWLCRSSNKHRGQGERLDVTVFACVLRHEWRCHAIKSPTCTGACDAALAVEIDNCMARWEWGDKASIHLSSRAAP